MITRLSAMGIQKLKSIRSIIQFRKNSSRIIQPIFSYLSIIPSFEIFLIIQHLFSIFCQWTLQRNDLLYLFFLLYNNPIYFQLPVNNPIFKILFIFFVANRPFKKINEIAIIFQAYDKVDHCINSNGLYIHIPSTRGVQKSDPLDPTRRPI